MTNEDIIQLALAQIPAEDHSEAKGLDTLILTHSEIVKFYKSVYDAAIKDAADYLASIHSGNFHSLATEIKQHFGVEQ